MPLMQVALMENDFKRCE